MKSSVPLISIITPSFNRAGMIETAIQSVLDQHYPNFEHIIIDGGSTDGTLDVLQKYPHLRVISEPDQGMYDALNKGLKLATGDIIGFLNTDDFYAPGVFSRISILFEDATIDAAAGLAAVVDQSTPTNPISVLSPARETDRITHTCLDLPIFNAYFFRKYIFQQIGNFDNHLRIASDRDFMLRLMIKNFSIAFINIPVYYYLRHSDSMTFDYSNMKFQKIAIEHLKISQKYLSGNSESSQELRTALIEMRTQDTIRACAHSLRDKEFNNALLFFKEGYRYNSFWILRFLKHALIQPIRQKLTLPYKLP